MCGCGEFKKSEKKSNIEDDYSSKYFSTLKHYSFKEHKEHLRDIWKVMVFDECFIFLINNHLKFLFLQILFIAPMKIAEM